MPQDPINAYQDIEKETLSGRELEASVLKKAATRLRAVRDQWGQPNTNVLLEEVLRYNQRIWTLLQVELVSPDNPLPHEIKQNLLTLSVFIDKRTFETMAYPSPDKLDVLININHNSLIINNNSPKIIIINIIIMDKNNCKIIIIANKTITTMAAMVTIIIITTTITKITTIIITTM